MFRNSELLHWPSSSLLRGGIRSSSTMRDFLSLSWSVHLIYLPTSATCIPITNFPYDIAFRALYHHWKVLFSQELTSFSKNRTELHCRASRRSATPSPSSLSTPAGTCNSASWNWIYPEEKGSRFDPLAENASRWR